MVAVITASLSEKIFLIKTYFVVVHGQGSCNHYENTPMQDTAIFHGCKNYNFRLNFFYYFHIFAQNIDCGYTLPCSQRKVL